jgi:hypothetical protein
MRRIFRKGKSLLGFQKSNAGAAVKLRVGEVLPQKYSTKGIV